jgi:hypothetical protein
MEAQQRHVRRFEQQRRAERHRLAEQVYLLAARTVSCTELAGFVEFAVIGEIALRYHALNHAASNNHRTVEQQVVDLQWQPDHHGQGQAERRLDDGCQRRRAGIEQRALVEQVVASIGRQSQLGKCHQHGAAFSGFFRKRDGFRRVEQRVGDAAGRNAYRHPCEIVRIEIKEFLGLHLLRLASPMSRVG